MRNGALSPFYYENLEERFLHKLLIGNDLWWSLLPLVGKCISIYLYWILLIPFESCMDA